jgi:transposase
MTSPPPAAKAMHLRAYRIELRPTAEQRIALVRTEGAARFSYNWALALWREWSAVRALAIGLRALEGIDEKVVKAVCAVATGLCALDWRHSPSCPRSHGKSRCTKATCDKTRVYQQCYEPGPSGEAIHALLVRAKSQHPELSWLDEVTAYAPREAVADVADAYSRFFRVMGKHASGDHSECGVRRDGGCAIGEPVFRSRARGRRWHADQANSRDGKNCPLGLEIGKTGKSARIKIPGVGWVKVAKGCRLPPSGARLSAVGLSERAGRWFAALRFEAPLLPGHSQQAPRESGTRLGVSTGVRELAVTSDGERFGAVRDLATLKKAERKLRLWERRKARRWVNGKPRREQSRRWHYAVDQIQKYHALAADCRRNLLHQTSHKIVAKGAETVAMRDQAVRRMLGRGAHKHEVEKRNKLAPMIQACGGMYELRRQVEYKQAWAGGKSVVVPSNEPTTRACWHCKTVRETEPPYGIIGESHWRCANCGKENERELNDALNCRDFSPEQSGGKAEGRTGPPNGSNPGTVDGTEVTETATSPGASSSSRRSDRRDKRTAGTGARRKAGEHSPATAPASAGRQTDQLEGEHRGSTGNTTSSRSRGSNAGSGNGSPVRAGPGQGVFGRVLENRPATKRKHGCYK